MTKPLIIAVAPNGARLAKSDHPALPLAPREVGLEAARCREAGAAMIHLHVRDAEDRHTLDLDRYREAIAAVRREAGPEMIVQVTTEAVGLYAPAEQMAAIAALRPEAFSVAVRELFAEPDDEAAAASFLAGQARAGTLVQHILYDAGDVTRFQGLVARGLIPLQRASVLFVLGRYSTGQRSQPSDLLPFLAAWNSGHHLDLPWALCAFGRREAACLIAAACLGGDVRVGFENNLWRPDGSLAPDNAAQVAALAALARGLGIEVAGPAVARTLLAARR
ncbi:3-keto-5-aminohexanoate cleavage protein [Methylobacterium sp. WSM2598]|uniref:3-keto-5-aminohexanoate cleavage protein n=1 Tax=Methylobacterium sp. WSM2598 TaxID=398261 RepID=UPI00038173F0|nr:3-keto-5-aminohexanoate cleavage protein [Methylobacterium sp. WSM2598]